MTVHQQSDLPAQADYNNNQDMNNCYIKTNIIIITTTIISCIESNMNEVISKCFN